MFPRYMGVIPANVALGLLAAAFVCGFAGVWIWRRRIWSDYWYRLIAILFLTAGCIELLVLSLTTLRHDAWGLVQYGRIVYGGAETDIRNGTGKTPLIWAAARGHEDLVRRLLAMGAEVEEHDDDGLTPLYWATIHNRASMIDLLVAQGAMIEVKTSWSGSHPLHFATRMGLADAVQALVNQGADVMALDERGQTPLHGVRNNVTSMDVLLGSGAEVNVRDHAGLTPLHRAAWHANRAVIQRLLEAGADPNASDQNGRTPLHNVLFQGQDSDLEVTALLLDAGADIKARDVKGNTPLHYAVQIIPKADLSPTLITGAHKSVARKVVPYLIDHGADVNARNQEGVTPLLASMHNVEYECRHPWSPFPWTWISNLRDLVKARGVWHLLIKAGADMDVADRYGESAWTWAQRNSSVFCRSEIALKNYR